MKTQYVYKDFEDFLQEKHAKQYVGTDDNMPDDFNHWLCEEQSVDDWIKYGNEYAASEHNRTLKAMNIKAMEAVIYAVGDYASNHKDDRFGSRRRLLEAYANYEKSKAISKI